MLPIHGPLDGIKARGTGTRLGQDDDHYGQLITQSCGSKEGEARGKARRRVVRSSAEQFILFGLDLLIIQSGSGLKSSLNPP